MTLACKLSQLLSDFAVKRSSAQSWAKRRLIGSGNCSRRHDPNQNSRRFIRVEPQIAFETAAGNHHSVRSFDLAVHPCFKLWFDDRADCSILARPRAFELRRLYAMALWATLTCDSPHKSAVAAGSHGATVYRVR